MASLTGASRKAEGNRHGRRSGDRSRAAVFKGGESNGYDPKPDDLRADKVKHGESYVEAC